MKISDMNRGINKSFGEVPATVRFYWLFYGRVRLKESFGV